MDLSFLKREMVVRLKKTYLCADVFQRATDRDYEYKIGEQIIWCSPNA